MLCCSGYCDKKVDDGEQSVDLDARDATDTDDHGAAEVSGLWKPVASEVIHEKHEVSGKDIEWMNYLARSIWPYARQAAIKIAGVKFKEAMGAELATHPEIKLKEISLKFDPGSKPPVMSHLRVYQRTQQERSGVQLDMDFNFSSDAKSDFTMAVKLNGKAGPITIDTRDDPVGLSAMEISGTMSVLLAPLLPIEPCVGTGQVFFLDTPSMKLKVMGIKRLGAGLGKLVTKVMEGLVLNVLQDSYILPNRYTHRVRKDLSLDTLVNMKSPPPLGVLKIQVLEGRGLTAADVSLFGKKSSDPFVEIEIGHGKARTSTVENTVNPVWDDMPVNMLVYNAAQLVCITAMDDDVMTSDDALGKVIGYNVYLFCKETNDKPDGVWFDLYNADGKTKAGQLKIRAQYFDVEDLAAEHKPVIPVEGQFNFDADDYSHGKDVLAAPYVLTVKLLGLEAEDPGDLRGARATVELKHPEDDRDFKKDKDEHRAKRLMRNLRNHMEETTNKLKHATGLGFGDWSDGVPKTRRSSKAVLWGKQVSITDTSHTQIPPMVIRAMEKLHMREKLSIKQIAFMFALEPSVVRAAVDQRGNFEVSWHEALHFIQPADNPHHGTIKISVSAPVINQVRGADDRGFIGEAEFDLAELSASSDHKYCQRVRKVLARPKAASTRASRAEEPEFPLVVNGGDGKPRTRRMSSIGETQFDTSVTESGVLIEVLVEVRQLTRALCVLDSGQAMRDQERLSNASLAAGVKILSEQ